MSNDLNADAFIMYSKNTTKPLYKVTKLRQRPIIIKRCIYEDLKNHFQSSICIAIHIQYMYYNTDFILYSKMLIRFLLH